MPENESEREGTVLLGNVQEGILILDSSEAPIAIIDWHNELAKGRLNGQLADQLLVSVRPTGHSHDCAGFAPEPPEYSPRRER